MDNDEPRDTGGQGRTYPLRGNHSPLRYVKATSSAHQIGNDHRKNRAIDARANSVQ
jgi:hypothetical protein